MTKTKAFRTWIAFSIAFLPCLLALNKNASAAYINIVGTAYGAFIAYWLRSTPSGRKAAKAIEQANKVLFRIETTE